VKVKVLLSVHGVVKAYGGVELQLLDPVTGWLHVVCFTPWLFCHRYKFQNHRTKKLGVSMIAVPSPTACSCLSTNIVVSVTGFESWIFLNFLKPLTVRLQILRADSVRCKTAGS